MCCILDREIPDVVSVVRAAVVKSEPVIWKAIWRKLLHSTKASKIKIQKIVFAHFLPKTRLKRNQARIQTMKKFWAGILRR